MIRMMTAAALLIASTSAFADARTVAITGSMQFWQRSCDEFFECGLPTAASERVNVSSVISEPPALGEVTAEQLYVNAGPFSARLGVYWKSELPKSYLAGQTLLTVNGLPVAECSYYGSDDVASFLPVGFCAGYAYEGESIIQYGVTYYRAAAE